ncbi:hypothetical protein CCP3SC1_370018 [Gammaproteobacteria bacterium]
MTAQSLVTWEIIQSPIFYRTPTFETKYERILSCDGIFRDKNVELVVIRDGVLPNLEER